MKNKKTAKILLTVCLVLSFAVCSAVAYLYFESEENNNSFSVGSIEVSIVEEGVDKDAVKWGKDSKPVRLQNNGSVPCVVRAMVVPSAVQNGEVRLGDIPGIIGAPTDVTPTVTDAVVAGDITLYFDASWEDNWFYKDGYFYYKTVLGAGETTQLLLNGVVFTDNTEAMRQKYESIDVKIDVLADSLQVEAMADWNLKTDEDTGNIIYEG